MPKIPLAQAKWVASHIVKTVSLFVKMAKSVNLKRLVVNKGRGQLVIKA
jgi:hypothetical protein